MAAAFSGLIKLLYPAKCVFCSEIITSRRSKDICEDCYAKLPHIGWRGEISRSDRFDTLTVLFPYNEMIKDSLTRFKFHGKQSYFRTYADLMHEKLSELINTDEIDYVMSVPLHRRRKIKRGYNQSQLISERVADKLGKPDISKLLLRTRNTEAQSGLEKDKRNENVKNAFRVRDSDLLKGSIILLIDDIITTGSTMNECCKALKLAGVAKIHAAAAASGRIQE